MVETNNKKWYVVRAVSGQESKIKDYIVSEVKRLGFEKFIEDILVPTEKVIQIRNGKKISKEKVYRMKSPIHLNALKAFEASARHQSFSAAAEELNVTPAAVGQLVKTLEEWLDTPLFHRMSSGKTRLVTTETAQSALPLIREGFDKLAQGLEILKFSWVTPSLLSVLLLFFQLKCTKALI